LSLKFKAINSKFFDKREKNEKTYYLICIIPKNFIVLYDILDYAVGYKESLKEAGKIARDLKKTIDPNETVLIIKITLIKNEL